MSNFANQSGMPSRTQLGSYRLVKRIGSGGMGEVYKAVHVGMDRIVALKVLSSYHSHLPTNIERFRREAKAAAALSHENIVSIHDQGELDGVYYIAFEYVEGKNLSQIIHEKERLSIRHSVEIIKQAAKALGHAHARGIIHRDIKPSNFLIRDDGVVKLADLGLAHRLEDLEYESRVTRDGTTVGTVDYIAPEQARDSKLADTRSDIYSLGCTLFHMLTGHPPYAEGTLIDKLRQHASGPVPNAREHNPAIPLSLATILDHMLAKRPRDRYQGVNELLAELEKVRLEGSTDGKRLKSLAESKPSAGEAAPLVPARKAGERVARDHQALHGDEDVSTSVAQFPDAKQVAQIAPPQLKSTTHDRATSFLMSLILIMAVSVVWLGSVWLTNRVWADPVMSEIELIQLGGGDPQGAKDEELDVESLEEEFDDLATPQEEFEEQEVQQVVENVLDVIAQESFDLRDPRETEEKQDRGEKARKIGRGARGFGEGPGEGGLSREDRWQIVYDQQQILNEYARQLDFFGIELGAVLGPRRLVYLSKLSSPQPEQREVSGGTDEDRLYLLWRGGGRRAADLALFRRANISVGSSILMQFLPAAVESQLAQIENDYAQKRRRKREEIRQTRFGVRPNDSGDGYEFYVIDQAYL